MGCNNPTVVLRLEVLFKPTHTASSSHTNLADSLIVADNAHRCYCCCCCHSVRPTTSCSLHPTVH
jgi:hypothetical protein